MSAGRHSCRANGPRRCARRVRATAHSIWPHAWRKATPPATPTGVRRQHAIMPVPAMAQPRISNGKAFVDFQNDVTAKDLVIAAQEGFRSIEHVKRYTTTGMATDQGKTSNMNALAMVADLLHQPMPQVGHTTFRMPYTPVTFGALAGAARDDLFEPVRRTPIHDWAAAHGAVFENVGTWQRARWFPHDGEDMHRAVARECRAVRNAVGMFDATTLGKIEVVGPDAAEFLDRLYTGSFSAARAGPLPLRRAADRGRLRDGRWRRRPAGTGSLPRHHNDRRCGRCAASHGRLSADRIPRTASLAHVGHRAMGGDRRAGPAGAPGDRAADHGYRSRAGRDAAYERARGSRLRHPGATVPCQLHRRTRATRSTCRRTTDLPSGRQCTLPANRMASRPTAPRRCTCCAPRRATSSSARKPMAR